MKRSEIKEQPLHDALYNSRSRITLRFASSMLPAMRRYVDRRV